MLIRLLMAALVLPACASGASAADAAKAVPACAPVPGTAKRLELEDLVRDCDLAVEGKVLSTRAVRDARGRIVTEHVLQVGRTFVGDATQLRTVRLPGGTLPDGSGMVVPGMPRLAAGTECVLFLAREDSQGVRLPVGLAQGAWSVVRTKDGLRRVVRDQAGLAFVEDGRVREADPRGEMDYAAFAARVEAARARRPAVKKP